MRKCKIHTDTIDFNLNKKFWKELHFTANLPFFTIPLIFSAKPKHMMLKIFRFFIHEESRFRNFSVAPEKTGEACNHCLDWGGKGTCLGESLGQVIICFSCLQHCTTTSPHWKHKCKLFSHTAGLPPKLLNNRCGGLLDFITCLNNYKNNLCPMFGNNTFKYVLNITIKLLKQSNINKGI